MTIKVEPIPGDDPGVCDIEHGEQLCGEEAVVAATVPVPGTDKTVTIRVCRQDWADIVAAEHLDLRKTIAQRHPADANGNMTLGAYPPMRDND